MRMTKEKRTYKNSGVQTEQGKEEALKFRNADPEDFFTVKGISLVLKINRNAVVKIPVKRYLINKRAYYRKGEIESWMKGDLARPDSLLRQLQFQQGNAIKRLRQHKSRIYEPGIQSPEEAKKSKSASTENLRRIKERAKAKSEARFQALRLDFFGATKSK